MQSYDIVLVMLTVQTSIALVKDKTKERMLGTTPKATTTSQLGNIQPTVFPLTTWTPPEMSI